MNTGTEIDYLGFRCRVLSADWAELISRHRREQAMSVEERTARFLRTLEDIRELPEAA